MAVEATLDHLAFTFRKLGVKTISLEQLAEKADVTLFDISPDALRNAMLQRGVLIKDGKASAYDGHDFQVTVAASFRRFVERALDIIENSLEPVTAVELIGMVGLVEGAMPLSSMSHHLRKVGIWHIPGVGFWHRRHYVDGNGILYGARPGSEQSGAVMEAFKEYGWPMTAEDIEATTRGKVTRRYVTQAVKRPWPDILSIGYGLYVPAGAARRAGLPISRNLAKAFLDLDPDELIDSKDNTRMFRLCDLLQRMGYGISKPSSTVRDGKQRRTVYFKLNDTGRKALSELVGKKKPDDEF